MKYVCIDNLIVQNRDLNPIDKLLYGLLLFGQNKNKYCKLSQFYISQRLGSSVNTIRGSLRRLEAFGLVRIAAGQRVAYNRHEAHRYYVEPVKSGGGFLLIDSKVLASKSINATDKIVRSYLRFRVGDHMDCWPDQKQIAAALGISRRTVIRSIGRLESQNLIQVRRSSIGKCNAYGITLKIETPLLLPKIHVTKLHIYNNNHKEKTLIYKKTIFQKVLSFPDPKQKAADRLRRHGVHPTVVNLIVFKQHTPLQSIHQTIDNGLVLEAWQKQNKKYGFRLDGYICKTLRSAQSECKLVKPTKLFRQAGQLAQVERWQPDPEKALTEAEFKAEWAIESIRIAKKLAG